jgi:CRISPR-associated protein Csd2
MKILNGQFNPTDIIGRRIDIVLFTFSINSVMNGDPDNQGNQRVDPVTGNAITTPVSTKAWIRSMAKRSGKDLYIDREGPPLAEILNAVAGEHSTSDSDSDPDSKKVGKKKKASKGEKVDIVATLATKYWDIRLFGGALTAPVNEQITGPVQMTFGTSLDPISATEYSITRGVVTKEEDREKERTMGKLPSVPFAMYRSNIHVNPFCARRVRATYQDLDEMLDYLIGSFDAFRSTIRSNNHFYKMYIFVHPDENGKESSYKLTNRVKTSRVRSPDWDGEEQPPTSLNDYEFEVDEEGLAAKGITLSVIEAQ